MRRMAPGMRLRATLAAQLFQVRLGTFGPSHGTVAVSNEGTPRHGRCWEADVVFYLLFFFYHFWLVVGFSGGNPSPLNR